MTGLKISLDAAMRARDVSPPGAVQDALFGDGTDDTDSAGKAEPAPEAAATAAPGTVDIEPASEHRDAEVAQPTDSHRRRHRPQPRGRAR